MLTITGKIKNILYKDENSGFVVINTNNDEKLTGIFIDNQDNLKNAKFKAVGEWKTHKKYGRNFVFNDLIIDESELFYFLSRVIKGIGESLARRLIDQYGDDELCYILENNPKKLLSTKGIKEKKLSKITQSWNNFKSLREISVLLIPAGATPTMIKKIYTHYSDKINYLIENIKTNPYLITQVKGIGFKKADEIALGMGLSVDNIHRIESAIIYIIKQKTDSDGNSYLKKNLLYQITIDELRVEAKDSFELSIEKFEEIINNLQLQDEIKIIGDDLITTAALNYSENFILKEVTYLSKLSKVPILDSVRPYIAKQEKELSMKFSKEQKDAIEIINSGVKIFSLLGYAGSGKSTISKSILKLLEIKHSKDTIICCALSGIASDRIRKTTGFNSSTIQSLLIKLENSQDKKLPFDVVLLDEASMVNSTTLFSIIKALKKGSTFIMVGDSAQLPPIGAGNPFADLNNLSILPKVELTKIYRQSPDKVITYFASFIRNSQLPPNYLKRYDDFEFIDISIQDYWIKKNSLSPQEMRDLRDKNANNILSAMESIARKYKNSLMEFYSNKDMYNYISLFQIITPLKKGILGSDALNIKIQQLLNPKQDIKKVINLGLIKFHIKDKVIHIQNSSMDAIKPSDYGKDNKRFKRRVFNGMIGVLFFANLENELLYVYYPSDEIIIEYSFDEARDYLRLAYALTIHKTQGSEYQNVLIPLNLSQYIMLNNKLLYTAITRAKDSVSLIGEKYAFEVALKKDESIKRDTIIKYNIESFK